VKTRALPLLLVAGLAGTLSRPTPAQETPQASFGATVEVRVVNVDVEVTDRDGVPVNGLEKGDFELLVDGKPVEITNFDRATRPVPPSAPAAEPAAAAPAAGAAGSERPKLTVWIDDLHLIPAHRNRVLKELASLLEDQETLGVEIGIVRYDRGLQILRVPGDRSRPIEQVIGEITRKTATGLLSESARRIAFSEIDDLLHQRQGCGLRSEMEAAAERYAAPLRNDTLSSYRALEDFVASLAGLPGRRALLYVADALPLDPGQEAFLYVDQVCPGPGGGTYRTGNLALQLRDVSSAANAAGVTFYTYDAGGLPVGIDAGSFSRGLDAGSAMVARSNNQDSLQTLASDTGGRALLNANRVAALVEQIHEDISTAYSLGFSPTGPADGKAHKIEVRVKREGVIVRHRDSFTDRPNSARRTDQLMAALRFGGGENPLGVQLEVAPSKPDGKELLELPLHVLVPAKGLVFQPGEDGVVQVEVAIAVSDDRGRSAPVQRRTFSVERSKLGADVATAVLRIPFDLKLRRGPTNLAIAVRDMAGDTSSILRSALDLR